MPQIIYPGHNGGFWFFGFYFLTYFFYFFFFSFFISYVLSFSNAPSMSLIISSALRNMRLSLFSAHIIRPCQVEFSCE